MCCCTSVTADGAEWAGLEGAVVPAPRRLPLLWSYPEEVQQSKVGPACDVQYDGVTTITAATRTCACDCSVCVCVCVCVLCVRVCVCVCVCVLCVVCVVCVCCVLCGVCVCCARVLCVYVCVVWGECVW